MRQWKVVVIVVWASAAIVVIMALVALLVDVVANIGLALAKLALGAHADLCSVNLKLAILGAQSSYVFAISR